MPSAERRSGKRLPVEVKVDYRTFGGFITDYSRDVSEGGVFIQTALPLSKGETVRLRVTVPAHPLPLAAEGTVRWCRAPDAYDGLPGGMGVSFERCDAKLRDALRRLLEKTSMAMM